MPRSLLSPKNLDLLDFIYDNKILKTEHIQQSFFRDIKYDSVARVLRRLFDAGLISRDWLPLPPDAPNRRAHPSAVYMVAKQNLATLRKSLSSERRASDWTRFEDHYHDARIAPRFAQNTLYHEIGITRVKLALEDGLAQSDTLTLPFFLRTSPSHPDVSQRVMATLTKKDTNKSYQKPLPVNPDAFFMLKNDVGGSFYFLEFDNNTETTKEKLTNKFIAYTAYFKQGLFGKTLLPKFNDLYDLGITSFAKAGFRVLFVTTNQNRANDLFIKSTVLPSSALFNFTTIDQLEADPYGAIWNRKKEFEPFTDEYKHRKKTARPSVARAYRDESIEQMEKIAIP